MRATSRARQINRARPVRGSGNQAEAKTIWADFPLATLLALVPLVSHLEDMDHVLLQVVSIFPKENQQFLEDMERTWIRYVRVTHIFVMVL